MAGTRGSKWLIELVTHCKTNRYWAMLICCWHWRFVSSDAKVRIIDIMNATLSLPRSDHKENRPIIEKLEIPLLKRSRFLGVGGMNLKKLMAETGMHSLPCKELLFSLCCCSFEKVMAAVNCHYASWQSTELLGNGKSRTHWKWLGANSW